MRWLLIIRMAVLITIFVNISSGMQSRGRIIERALGILFESSRKETILNLVILIIRSLLPLAALFLIRYFVERITTGAGEGQPFPVNEIVFLVIAMAFTLLADDLLSSAGHYFSRKQSFLLEGHISMLIHGHAAILGLRFFEDPAFYDKLARAARDISWRPASMVSDIISLMRGVISFLAVGYVLRSFGIIPLAVLVVVFIPVLWIRIRGSRRLYEARKSVTGHSRRASYFSWLITGEKPAREVKLFDLPGYFDKLFRGHFAAAREPEIAVIRKNTLPESLSSVLKVTAFAGVLIYATLSYIRSGITAGEMVMYLVAFRQALVYLRETVTAYSGLAENRLFLQDLFEFLDLGSDISRREKASHVSSFEGIDVDDITFTYPGSSHPALEHVSLCIKKGEKLAIVGPNGSGKTTLVKLLCGLYDPDSGTVRLNGESIDRFDSAEYRKLFSVVFQDFMLYYLTAGDNIRLAGSMQDGDEERIRDAAARAGVSDLLDSLPDGFNTMLGRHTEGSRELSWGEWQKIAIARALYREAPVLILDEPSSSLDADTEYEIFSDLNRIINGRTCIFISHRLSNIRDADRIIVLDNGHLVETGSHDMLMASGGRYYSMFTRQKSMFI